MTEVGPPADHDSILFEVVKNALVSVADEMAITIVRTAHSQVVRDNMDFSTAICDANGRVIAQGCGIPFHLGAIPDAMQFLLRKYANDIRIGDVFIFNDPAEGGMHLPDMFMVRPIFNDGQLEAFSTCVAHYPDIGGRVAGGNAVDSTEIFQEGLQVPILKLYDAGKLNETLLTLLMRNVRVPQLVQGDLDAQQAACHVGEAGYLALIQRYGSPQMRQICEQILDYTEHMVRLELSRIRAGTYIFEDFIDDDGFNSGPIRIKVALTFSGDEVIADFEGTSPQVRSALNCTLSATKSAVYTALKCVMNEDILSNEGMYRPIAVRAPQGSIANALHPAARGARGLTAFRMVDVLFGALHSAVPGVVPAAGDGGATMVAIGGSYRGGSAFVFVDFISGGWGARPDKDGVDGTSPILANLSNVPVEEIELRQPVMVEEYGFVPDTGGPGATRGCLSVVRQFRFLEAEGLLQIRSDRRRFPPYGLSGGHYGAESWNILNPGPKQEILPTNITRPIVGGDVIRHVTAGGGGFGDPQLRRLSAVQRDLEDGKVSPAKAMGLYRVVWDYTSAKVDEVATANLRAARD